MWLSFGVEVWEFYFEGCSLGVSSDDGWCGYRFYRARFHEEVCFWWRRILLGLSSRVFFRVGCLFSGVLPLYGGFSLYFLIHRSLFFLSRDPVV
jgi:hypothetical protein